MQELKPCRCASISPPTRHVTPQKKKKQPNKKTLKATQKISLGYGTWDTHERFPQVSKLQMLITGLEDTTRLEAHSKLSLYSWREKREEPPGADSDLLIANVNLARYTTVPQILLLITVFK
jgi:hypothetical protein